MSKYLITTILFVNSIFMYAQTYTNGQAGKPVEYLDQTHLDYAFEGGYEGYQDFIKANIEFPKNSYQDQIEGLLLFYITIDTKKNKVEVTFLTKLDQRIEENVRSTFENSFSKWNFTEPGRYTFYQPIVYSLLPFYADNLEGDLPEVPAALPNKFLQLFIIIKSKRIPKDFDINNATDEQISERARTMYVRTQAAYEKALAAQKNEVAYALLTKLIRYNPLEKKYLFKRIELEKALEIRDYQAYDAMLLNDFMVTYENIDSYENIGPSLSSSVPLKIPFDPTSTKPEIHYDHTYSGGFTAFYNDLITILFQNTYDIIRNSEGFAFYEMKTDENGQIQIRILTHLGTQMGDILYNYMTYINGKWLQVEEPYYRIQPIIYSKEDRISQTLVNTLEEYKILKNPIFLDPIEFSFSEIGLIEPIAFKEETFHEASGSIERYHEAQELFDQMNSKGKNKQAMRALTELINRNPFNEKLIQMRLESNDKKTKERFGPYDQIWLETLQSLATNNKP